MTGANKNPKNIHVKYTKAIVAEWIAIIKERGAQGRKEIQRDYGANRATISNKITAYNHGELV